MTKFCSQSNLGCFPQQHNPGLGNLTHQKSACMLTTPSFLHLWWGSRQPCNQPLQTNITERMPWGWQSQRGWGFMTLPEIPSVSPELHCPLLVSVTHSCHPPLTGLCRQELCSVTNAQARMDSRKASQ